MTPEERKAWLAERRTGIGASDSAGAIGYKPKVGRVYGTPLSIHLDKLGLLPERDSDAMEWGRLLEPLVLAAYARETGRTVEPPAKRILRHPVLSWMIASLDALSIGDGDTRVVQAKTADAREAWAWGAPWTDEIPEQYIIQVQHEMAVVNLEVADVPVLIGGNDFRIYQVRRDDAFSAHLAALEEEFWQRVQRREPPPPDWTHPDTPRLLELLHRPVPGREVALEESYASDVRDYEQLGGLVRDYEKLRAETKARIVEAMGAAEFGLLPDGRRVRRRLQTRAAHPVKETQFYDFKILKAKGEKDGE